MNKEQREVRKRLKGINTVKQFEEMLDSVLISEEERRILNLIYKEQKPFSVVADEIGISERTLTRKHAKLLMKIGSMFWLRDTERCPFLFVLLLAFMWHI